QGKRNRVFMQGADWEGTVGGGPISSPYILSTQFLHGLISLAPFHLLKVELTCFHSVRENSDFCAVASRKDSAKDNAHVRPASRCTQLIRRQRGPDLLSRF